MHPAARPPRAIRIGRPRLAAAGLLALVAVSACACTSQNEESAGAAASPSNQASSIALPQPSGTAHPTGTKKPLLGSYATAPTPATLPCLHGSVTLTLRGNGSDPEQICAHVGTRITLHLPTQSVGPWGPPTLTGDPVATLTTTRDSFGTSLHLRVTATGTAEISIQTNASASVGAPSQTWHSTLTIVP